MKERHAKSNPNVRCCWICGKQGGNGFTTALRWLGYNVPMHGVVAHAHPACIAKLQRKSTRSIDNATEYSYLAS